MGRIGHFREAPDIGEKDRDVSASAAERQMLRRQEFVHDIGRDDALEHLLDPPLLTLFENDPIRYQRHVRDEQTAHDWIDNRNPDPQMRKSHQSGEQHHSTQDGHPDGALGHLGPPGDQSGEDTKSRQHENFRDQSNRFDKPVHDDGVGNVLISCDQRSVAGERGGAKVRDIVTFSNRANDAKLAGEWFLTRESHPCFGAVQLQKFTIAFVAADFPGPIKLHQHAVIYL